MLAHTHIYNYTHSHTLSHMLTCIHTFSPHTLKHTDLHTVNTLKYTQTHIQSHSCTQPRLAQLTVNSAFREPLAHPITIHPFLSHGVHGSLCLPAWVQVCLHNGGFVRPPAILPSTGRCCSTYQGFAVLRGWEGLWVLVAWGSLSILQ